MVFYFCIFLCSDDWKAKWKAGNGDVWQGWKCFLKVTWGDAHLFTDGSSKTSIDAVETSVDCGFPRRSLQISILLKSLFCRTHFCKSSLKYT